MTANSSAVRELDDTEAGQSLLFISISYTTLPSCFPPTDLWNDLVFYGWIGSRPTIDDRCYRANNYAKMTSTICNRAFSFAAPKLWNSTPAFLRSLYGSSKKFWSLISFNLIETRLWRLPFQEMRTSASWWKCEQIFFTKTKVMSYKMQWLKSGHKCGSYRKGSTRQHCNRHSAYSFYAQLTFYYIDFALAMSWLLLSNVTFMSPMLDCHRIIA